MKEPIRWPLKRQDKIDGKLKTQESIQGNCKQERKCVEGK